MELLTGSELLESYYWARDYAGLQFQYWLALSFAAIVAAHVARGQLSLRLQVCVATLYFLTSLLFFWLYIQASFEVAAHISELIKRQLLPSTGSRWVIVPRLLVWFIGTVVTLWFICRKEDIADVDQPESKGSQQS